MASPLATNHRARCRDFISVKRLQKVSYRIAGEPKECSSTLSGTSLLLSLVLVGCAQSSIRVTPPPTETTTAVITKDGATTERQEDRLLDRVLAGKADEAGAETLIDAIRKACPIALLSAGNHVSLLSDGPSTFAAYAEAIGKATHHIHLETYIFADDQLAKSFAELLAEKSRAGIEVRVLYDGIGSFAANNDIFETMRAAGVMVVPFRPPESLPDVLDGKINNRDHRKLLIVDGRTAFVGGINVSGTYSHGSSLKPGKEKGLSDGWRDSQVKLNGPVVAQLQALFFSTWVRSGGQADASSTTYFPVPVTAGGSMVAALGSESGDQSEAAIYAGYLAAIRAARHQLWITQAYFVPDQAIRDELKAAARRGVDTRVLVPGFSDSFLALNAARAVYGELLASGVKIYEYDIAFVHAKTLVVDGVVSFVGSANMDMRSLVHNNEVTAVIVDPSVAADMSSLYLKDLTGATMITLQAWKARSFPQRVREGFANLFWYWI